MYLFTGSTRESVPPKQRNKPRKRKIWQIGNKSSDTRQVQKAGPKRSRKEIPG